MKRTPWLSWRLYFLTIPIDLAVVLLSGEHASTGSNDFFNWAILALLAHASIAPVTGVALFFTSKIDSWKTDLLALIFIGAVRGIAINVGFKILDLEPKVTFAYKVFNSAVSLPLWFIGVAIFVESRRQFQHEFEALFLRAVRKEQASTDNNSDSANLRQTDSIQHLQAIASELAQDIDAILRLPISQVNYAKQAREIQDLVNNELKPASAQLWSGSNLSSPKLSIRDLMRISLLEDKLKVVSVSLFFSPYIFIGINGPQGFMFAFVATVIATSMNIAIFYICETLYKNGISNRRTINFLIMILSFLATLVILLFVLPERFFWTESIATKITYQLFLTVCHVFLLLGFNIHRLLHQQRSAVLENFEQLIKDKDLTYISGADLDAARDIDLARYLHGELQAGLIATSLLLERASSTGDIDLARHALRSAVDLLKQDHAQVSQSRVSSPRARLEKISSGWRGIAEVTFNQEWVDALENPALNDVITLIDEAVSNAVRHAQATNIVVDGKHKGSLLEIDIVSDGKMMTNNAAGLGTRLFTELTSNWQYSRSGEKNLFRFAIRITN